MPKNVATFALAMVVFAAPVVAFADCATQRDCGSAVSNNNVKTDSNGVRGSAGCGGVNSCQ